MERTDHLVVLSPEDYATLDEDDFGVPGLAATEIIGPFMGVHALGPLIMVHDGVFEPHHGIGHHPHRYNERLFYILEGAVDHDDALNGITGHMGTGDLGRLTEGLRGMLHKEWNNTDGRARAFILVYGTNVDPPPARASFAALRDGDAPRYEEAAGVTTKELVGLRVRFPIHGDIRLFTDSTLDPGAALEVGLNDSEGGLLFPLEGRFELDGSELAPGNAALLPPAEGGRSHRVRAREGGRLIRVVHGPGHGFVMR
jgi:redox-sensitive bicupin YhaK (pirin superfamily)